MFKRYKYEHITIYTIIKRIVVTQLRHITQRLHVRDVYTYL